MNKFLTISLLIFLLNCSPASRFGAGVDITFDPRTIGMQIDDTIMQKNLVARLSLNEKKYFLKYSGWSNRWKDIFDRKSGKSRRKN